MEASLSPHASFMTAENIQILLQDGSISLLLQDNVTMYSAFILARDVGLRPPPDEDQEARPAIAAAPAILDAAGNEIQAAIPAIPAYLLYDHTQGGALSAAGNVAFRLALRDYDKNCEDDLTKHHKSTQTLLKAFTPELIQTIKQHDLPRFLALVGSNSLYSLVQLAITAVNSTNTNNFRVALDNLLNLPKPEREYSKLISSLNCNYIINVKNIAQSVLCDAAHPDSLTLHQLATSSFVKTLNGSYDKEFFAWFTTTYPDGNYPQGVEELYRKFRAITLAIPKEIYEQRHKEASLALATTQSDQLSALLAEITAAHGSRAQALVAKVFKSKPAFTAFLSAVPVAVAKPRPPPVTSLPGKALAAVNCGGCGLSFVPKYVNHVLCRTCSNLAYAAKGKANNVVGADEEDGNLTNVFVYSVSPKPLLPNKGIPAFWDNGCSINLTSDLSLIHNPRPITPFKVGGPSASMTVTHVGILPNLPPNKNKMYYTADSTVTLLSIGYFCRYHGETHQDSTGLSLYDTTGPTKTLIDFTLTLENNLSPVSSTFWTTILSGPTVLRNYWAEAFPSDAPTDAFYDALKTALLAYHSSPNVTRHYTPEEIKRADEVERFHRIYTHLNDHDLGIAFDHGLFRTPSNCTSKDVINNRILRLNCPQCDEGKMRNPSYPPSTNQPSAGIGATLSLDLEQLPEPSAPDGFTHQIMIVDEKTGELSVIGVSDKTGPKILNATLKFINRHYKAYGHTTTALTADAEPVFESLISKFGAHGLALTLMPPNQHAQRVERYQQTLTNRLIATVASIPFYFPTKYNLSLRNAVAFNMSLCPNTTSYPSSPFALRTGANLKQHALSDQIRIGSTCMVQSGDLARIAKSKLAQQTVKFTPKSELGVCMGHSQTTPGSYDFLLASGLIRPRRVVSLVNVIPFGFQPRNVLHTYIDRSRINIPASAPTPSPVSVAPAVNPTAPAAVVTPPVSVSTVPPVSAQPSVPSTVPLPVPTATPTPSRKTPKKQPRKTHNVEVDVAEIISHTGDLFEPETVEFKVRYSDNDIRYHFYHQLDDLPLLHDYIRHHQSHAASANLLQLPSQLVFSDLPPLDFDQLDALLSSPFADATSPPEDELHAYKPRMLLATALAPTPPVNSNLTLREALALNPAATQAAIDIEMNKFFVKFDVCRASEAIAYSAIPPTSLRQRTKLFFKQKFNADGSLNKFGARCVTDGSRQPASTYYDTFAAVCDTTDKLAMLSAYTARSIELNWPLDISTFDIEAFFLQHKLTPDNSPVPCYIQFPADIPHFSAGKWYPRHSTTYGTKDANHIADAHLAKVLASAGFFPNPEAPRIFTKFDPSDPRRSTSVSLHVDDGLVPSFVPQFKQDLLDALTKEYGPLEFHQTATSNTGLHLQRYTDGSLTIDQSGHIDRMLTHLGAAHLPYVSKPSAEDFFNPPTNTTPIDKTYYQHLIGNLIYCMISLPHLRMHIQHLATRQSAPTQSDLDKVIRLLAYLNHHRDQKLRVSHPDYQVKLWCDASYGIHSDGRSHDGYFITIGAGNAAIYAHSGKQIHCVAQGSMEAEYVALTPGIKRALHLRRLLHSMGFSQTQPISVYEDNQAAIKLASAPSIPRKSQHIHVRYHFVRDLIQQKIITLLYVPTDQMIADLLTKSLPASTIERLTKLILNESPTPLTPLISE